jgi:hypothetical protein
MAMPPESTHGLEADADQGAEGGFDPLADILPDELVDKHFVREPQVPAASHDLDDPDDGDEDTLDDEDPDLDDEEVEGDDAEGEDELDDDLQDDDDEDEDEDEDEEESEDEESEEDAVLNVSATELKAIEANPTLRKIHKLMQRDYTRKTTAVAGREKVAEQKEKRINEFESAVQSPKGMVQFLSKNLREHPDIIGAAFNAVATEDGADNFLLEVALAKPAVFEKAYQRFQELSDDEDALARHVERRDMASESRRVARDLEALRQERFDREAGTLLGEALRVAKKLGAEKEDIAEIRDAVARKVAESVNRKTGSVDISKDEVRKLVKVAKKEIDARLEKARKALARRDAAGKQKDVRTKAKRSKAARRAVPGRGSAGGGSTTKRQASRMKPPEGVDSLDFYINKRLGIQ